MEPSRFEEGEFFAAITTSATRAILIGRRALIALGFPLLTRDYDFWIHGDEQTSLQANKSQLTRPVRLPADIKSRCGSSDVSCVLLCLCGYYQFFSSGGGSTTWKEP